MRESTKLARRAARAARVQRLLEAIRAVVPPDVDTATLRAAIERAL